MGFLPEFQALFKYLLRQKYSYKKLLFYHNDQLKKCRYELSNRLIDKVFEHHIAFPN